jgi:pimeloyl-ACP methyl ester carboxylesterase
MPLNYQLYENYIANITRLDIPKAAANIDVPWLIIHGTNDTSVPSSFGEQLHQWNTNSELFLIENADHTFGGKHPWNEDSLPNASTILIQKTISFLLN